VAVVFIAGADVGGTVAGAIARIGPVPDGSGTPALYVANYGDGTITAYPTTASGNASPAVTITGTGGSLDGPAETAFDRSGDLWVPDSADDTVVEFSRSQLGASGTPDPKATISSNDGSLRKPTGVAFDGSGDLWVVNSIGDTVVEYDQAQLDDLASVGDPHPVSLIAAASHSLTAPWDLAFDHSGDLWVTNPAVNTVVGYSAAQLSDLSSVADPEPSFVMSTGFDVPYALAFDGSGDLWVANCTSTSPTVHGSIEEFAPGQLTPSGSPSVRLTSDADESLNCPRGLTFDGAGGLWVSNFAISGGGVLGSLVEYTPNQLSTSGDPTPSEIIKGTGTGLDEPMGVAILPAMKTTTPHTKTTTTHTKTTTPHTKTTTHSTGTPHRKTTSQPIVAPAPAPDVRSLSPSSGPAAGSTTVTVHGTGFTRGSAVRFGAAPATSVTFVNPSDLIAVAPPGFGTVDVTVTSPAGTSSLVASDRYEYLGGGYWESASDGGLFAFGDAGFYGSMGGRPLDEPIVGLASTPDRDGYWEVASDGGLFAFGDAGFYGSMGGRPLDEPIVGMAPTPDGGGYWEVAKDGGLFAFGDAAFYGSMGGRPLDEPIVGMTVTPDGGGYWEVASDGGLFAFGDAAFYGSMGGRPLDEPIVGMAPTPGGGGYWEVASDGGLFAFGDAAFYGSMGGIPLDAPVVGMAATADGRGYWEVASDGGMFAFGDAGFYGSMGGKPLFKPIVGLVTS
jgi:hypothetical protein